MKNYFLAWWNLENLFDVENSGDRPDWLQKELKNDLKGWTKGILDKKISQLSTIIKTLNNGAGPDILGVCEVENKPVVDLLVKSLQPLGRNYKVKHHDTPDQRGIDIAFIYDSAKFKAEKQFFYVILRRTGTRDLFQVNFRTANKRLLVLIGNHWPSRTAGELETEPFRILAGETLSYWLKRIPEKTQTDVGIVLTGDFNDEPFNRSLTRHALASNSEKRVRRAKNPMVFNLMWPFLGKGLGSFYFDSTPNVLDQFMISKSILNEKSGFKVKRDPAGAYSVNIEAIPTMTSKGKKPIPFGRPSKSLNKSGFSDHFPVSMELVEI